MCVVWIGVVWMNFLLVFVYWFEWFDDVVGRYWVCVLLLLERVVDVMVLCGWDVIWCFGVVVLFLSEGLCVGLGCVDLYW